MEDPVTKEAPEKQHLFLFIDNDFLSFNPFYFDDSDEDEDKNKDEDADENKDEDEVDKEDEDADGNMETDVEKELAKEPSCSCHCPEFQSGVQASTLQILQFRCIQYITNVL